MLNSASISLKERMYSNRYIPHLSRTACFQILCSDFIFIAWARHSRPLQTVLNPLRLRQNGRHFFRWCFKYIFLNENEWILIKISLKFVLAPTRRQVTEDISMAGCKTAASLLLMHWRYCSLPLSHQFPLLWYILSHKVTDGTQSTHQFTCHPSLILSYIKKQIK